MGCTKATLLFYVAVKSSQLKKDGFSKQFAGQPTSPRYVKLVSLISSMQLVFRRWLHSGL